MHIIKIKETMKTAEEILKEQGVLMIDFISSSAHGAVIEAMKAYASQAIDECLKQKVNLGDKFDDIVNVSDILKVKSSLK